MGLLKPNCISEGTKAGSGCARPYRECCSEQSLGSCQTRLLICAYFLESEQEWTI